MFKMVLKVLYLKFIIKYFLFVIAKHRKDQLLIHNIVNQIVAQLRSNAEKTILRQRQKAVVSTVSAELTVLQQGHFSSSE